jgi:RimJ/RimL family protein N-acetyltransferase
LDPLAIPTARLDLLPLTPDFLRATAAGDRTLAATQLHATIPADWFECHEFAAMRLWQFQTGETAQPWLPRAIVLRATGAMVGFIGFHTPPRPAYLQPLSPAGVEFGYTVFPEHRRRGYAREASRALIDWAHTTHGLTHFVVSVSPSNSASLALIAQMGFRRIGAHIDAEDGPEDIFELVVGSSS